MVYCFAIGCNCHDSYRRCSFFRFPADNAVLKKWDNLCRRKDRVAKTTDRLCSCHFKDGKKENGPTIFDWNKDKTFDFPDISQKRTRSKQMPVPEAATADESLDDVEEQLMNYDHVATDHSYSYACPTSLCQTKFAEMQGEIKSLELEIQGLVSHIAQLQKQRPFTIEDISDDDDKMLLYTSVTYDVFKILSSALKRFKIQYYNEWRSTMTLEDQLLITFMKLRLNLKDLDLAQRFQISRSTVGNIVYTFVHALHELLFEGILAQGIPSQLKCRGSLPKSFKEFASTRIIIDATEFTQDIPSNLNKQSECYSHYKSRHTVKAVTGVAPNGALVFSSSLYPGSVSDVAIVQHSKFLDQFTPGDLIIADKGFTIFDKLPKGVSLNIPPFLAAKHHFTKQEAEIGTKIGRARIHIERANERTKNFEILNHVPAHYRPIATKIFQLCSSLINMQAPLLKEIAQNYKM